MDIEKLLKKLQENIDNCDEDIKVWKRKKNYFEETYYIGKKHAFKEIFKFINESNLEETKGFKGIISAIKRNIGIIQEWLDELITLINKRIF